jgi:hypothetical protein
LPILKSFLFWDRLPCRVLGSLAVHGFIRKNSQNMNGMSVSLTTVLPY